MEAQQTSIQPGLVSVIMSNYNTPAEYLKEAIDSVLAQTYTDFELFIIDDASTDDSLRVIESYDDPRIKIIKNETNMGLTKSLNKALNICRGEFIARMDTDDICLPQRFESQVRYLREHPDVIVCGTWVERMFETEIEAYAKFSKTKLPDRESYRICLLFGNSPTLEHPSAMFSHRLLNQYHIRYNEKYRYAQDYRMWVSCSGCAECAIVPEVLLKFRKHAGSVSVEKNSKQKEFDYQIIQEQLDPLHLVLPDELKEYHWRLLQQRKPYDLRIKEWLRQLIAANEEYQVYDRKKFKNMIWNGWAHVCYFAFRTHKGVKDRVRILFSLSPRRYPELIRFYFYRKKKIKAASSHQ